MSSALGDKLDRLAFSADDLALGDSRITAVSIPFFMHATGKSKKMLARNGIAIRRLEFLNEDMTGEDAHAAASFPKNPESWLDDPRVRQTWLLSLSSEVSGVGGVEVKASDDGCILRGHICRKKGDDLGKLAGLNFVFTSSSPLKEHQIRLRDILRRQPVAESSVKGSTVDIVYDCTLYEPSDKDSKFLAAAALQEHETTQAMTTAPYPTPHARIDHLSTPLASNFPASFNSSRELGHHEPHFPPAYGPAPVPNSYNTHQFLDPNVPQHSQNPGDSSQHTAFASTEFSTYGQQVSTDAYCDPYSQFTQYPQTSGNSSMYSNNLAGDNTQNQTPPVEWWYDVFGNAWPTVDAPSHHPHQPPGNNQ